MNSHSRPDSTLDLSKDVPTTRDDVEILRRLRWTSASWLTLSSADLERLLPEHGLDHRPCKRGAPPPFELP